MGVRAVMISMRAIPMKTTRIRITGAAIIVAALIMRVAGWRYFVGATNSAATPATPQQQSAFKAVIDRAHHVKFDAWKTGDVSSLASVYYNDASVSLSPDYQQFLAAHTTGVADALAKMTTGPKATLLYYVTLTEVTGNWYISNSWTTGNP